MPAIRSFDVFDTLLVRASGSAESVFLTLGRELSQAGLTSWTPEEFARRRVEAEKAALQSAPGGEADLAAIYRQLQLLGGPQDIGECMRRELAVEAAGLRAIPGMVAEVDEARRSGALVVFLSDMYAPSEWLRECLTQHGFFKDGDQVIVSNEWGASKQTGTLFPLVAGKFGGDVPRPLHMGDNLWSDVECAKAAGWDAMHRPVGQLTRYEKILADHLMATDGAAAAFAGTARLARLEVLYQARSQRFTWAALCAGIGAPVLTAYCAWLLHDARRRGLRRLVFLARDGVVLRNVTDVLIARLGISDMQTSCLHTSRQVFRMSSLTPECSELPPWVHDREGGISLESAMARVGLNPGDFRSEIKHHGLDPDTPARPLSDPEADLLRTLFREPKIIDAALKQATAMRKFFHTYLERELGDAGATTANPFALVDIGWRGTTFAGVLSHLSERVSSRAQGYLFAFLDTENRHKLPAQIHPYFHDARTGEGISSEASLVPLLEDFCTTPEGTLLGFTSDPDGTPVPVHRQLELSKHSLEKISLCSSIILTYAQKLDASWLQEQVDQRTFLPLWEEVMRECWLKPSPQEALEFATHHQEIDQAGYFQRPLITPYTLGEVVLWALFLRDLPPGIARWPEGRRLASGPAMAAAIDYIRRMHSCLECLPLLRRLPSLIRTAKSALRRRLSKERRS